MKIDNEANSVILPARIVEYFPETQTATIQVCAEYITQTAKVHGQVKERTPIEGVPVHTPSGGGWALTFPIKKGNPCLIVFSQVGYDHWLYEDKDTGGLLANNPSPWLRRSFQEDDGFALVGFNTLPQAISNYSATDSQWRNVDATQNITLLENGEIEVNSPVKVTVNAPSIVINCETAEVVASTSVTLDTPITTCTGNLVVAGAIGTGGAAAPASGAKITGPVVASEDVTAGTVSLQGHTHNYTDDGSPKVTNGPN